LQQAVVVVVVLLAALTIMVAVVVAVAEFFMEVLAPLLYQPHTMFKLEQVVLVELVNTLTQHLVDNQDFLLLFVLAEVWVRARAAVTLTQPTVALVEALALNLVHLLVLVSLVKDLLEELEHQVVVHLQVAEVEPRQ
jgi:hypothetical protein